MDERERPGTLGRDRHQTEDAAAEQLFEHVVDGRARSPDRLRAVRARARRRQQRTLEVQARHARAGRAARRGERGGDGPVIGGAAADGRRQEGRHARRRQARRQRAQSGRVAAHLQAEAAVDLQIHEAGRHQLGIDARRGQRAHVAEADLRDASAVEDQRAADQISVDEQASSNG